MGMTNPHFLEASLRARPLMRLQDVYKLLYQAYLGVGHLVSNGEAALAAIVNEMAEAPAVSWDEDLWESISPEGTVGRVNLRPYRHRGLDPKALAEALFRFAQDSPGDIPQLARSWEEVGWLIREGRLGFNLGEYGSLTERLVRDNYPAMHHSRTYAEAYMPSYRILSLALYKELLKQGRG